MNPPPHANWAQYYDFVYENTYGPLYQRLTDLTVSKVRGVAPPPCQLVDFGAGTGRLSVPLASIGYIVTSVDPCRKMMEILLSKAEEAGVQIDSRIEKMQDFRGEGYFDVALCVFTTISYLLDEEALQRALAILAKSLNKGGRLLIDIPKRKVFQNLRPPQTPVLDRDIEVTPVQGDVYTYREQTRCLIDGRWESYEDTFSIRFWPAKTILSILDSNGVSCNGPIDDFRGTGADYYRGQKIR